MGPSDSAPPPIALTSRFDVAELSQEASTVVAVDLAGSITWVNPGWYRFARENDGQALLARPVVGLSYFEGITPPLRGFYESVFMNVARTDEVFEQEYECSSQERYRLMRLRVLPLGTSGLLLVHDVVREAHHEAPSHEPVEARFRGPNGLVVQCSNCRRVRRAGGTEWEWVRAWAATSPPDTSHGICRTCLDFYWGAGGSRAR